MASYTEKLEQKVAEHNDLHAQIQAGEEQLTGMKAQRERILGQVQLLQELAQEEQQEAAANKQAGQERPKTILEAVEPPVEHDE